MTIVPLRFLRQNKRANAMIESVGAAIQNSMDQYEAQKSNRKTDDRGSDTKAASAYAALDAIPLGKAWFFTSAYKEYQAKVETANAASLPYPQK